MQPLKFHSVAKPALWGCEYWMLPRDAKVDFPLLIKFIDAREDLSIQVHPDDALARERHGKSGKTEMWYVIDAQPGASLIAGFSRPVTPAEYERRVADGTLEEVMARHAVSAGDVFYLPAGQVHSLGGGVSVVEIQQLSDVTYRISDFGRTDASGNPRELHTELARAAIDFNAPPARIHYEHRPDREIPLVATPYFATSLYELTHPVRCALSDSFLAMIFLEGEGTLVDNEGNEMPVHRGETLLVPASTQWVEVRPHRGLLRFLTATV